MKSLARCLIVSFFCLAVLLPVKSYSLIPAGNDPGRTVSVFHYESGTMVSVYDKDSKSYQNYKNGRMTTTTQNAPEGKTGAVVMYTAHYDARGTLVSSVNEYGDVTTYNKEGMQVSTTHISYDYDNAGNVVDDAATGLPKEQKSVTTYQYNNLNQLVSVTAKDQANKVQSFQQYEYSKGQMVAVRSLMINDAGNITDKVDSMTTFKAGKQYQSFDKFSRVVSETSFDQKTGRQSDVNYLYNASGNQVVAGHNLYDDMNRNIGSTQVDETGAENRVSEVQYDSAGRRSASCNDATRTITYFDDRGNQALVKSYSDADYAKKITHALVVPILPENASSVQATPFNLKMEAYLGLVAQDPEAIAAFKAATGITISSNYDIQNTALRQKMTGIFYDSNGSETEAYMDPRTGVENLVNNYHAKADAVLFETNATKFLTTLSQTAGGQAAFLKIAGINISNGFNIKDQATSKAMQNIFYVASGEKSVAYTDVISNMQAKAVTDFINYAATLP